MAGYDTKRTIEEHWTYRELLEMIYVEDLEAINSYRAQKRYDEQQELENIRGGG